MEYDKATFWETEATSALNRAVLGNIHAVLPQHVAKWEKDT